MSQPSKIVTLLATVLTVAAVITWQATGGDFYTKYQVVEQVEVAIDEDDPLANTGFYDDADKKTETVTRDEFHLGLLPTPSGLFDKHAVSVISIASPPWGVVALMIFAGWMRKRKSGRT